MRVLPITNVNYNNETNFKGIQQNGTKFVQQTLPEAGKAAKLGAVAVLAYLGVNNANKSAENETNDFQIKELSGKEYVNKKIEIINHKKDFKAFEWVEASHINRYSVQLLDYMLQNPAEYNNPEYRYLATHISDFYSSLNNTANKLHAEVALRMLKMPWLLKSDDYIRDYGVVQVSSNIPNEKVKDIKLAILDKLDEYKDTRKFSKPQQIAIVEMLKGVSTKNGLKVALKILENPDILDDQNEKSDKGISKDFFKTFSNDKKEGKIKLILIDKINSKSDELFKTKYFKHSTAGILNNVIDEKTLNFVLKVLDNPQLFESQAFADDFGNILYHFPYATKMGDDKYKTERDLMYKILDAIEKRPHLFKNKKFLDDLRQLIFIKKEPYGDAIMSDERPIEIGTKNLFLIENGFYNN